MQDLEIQIQQLEKRIQQLEEKSRLPDYDTYSTYLPIENITNFLRLVSAAPTNVPRTLNEQVVIYINSGTYRLYLYDFTNNAWRYVALT